MGVGVERFQGGLRTGLKDDDLVLLFVGRLVEGKGIDYLLPALAILPSTLLHRTTAFAARLCVLATRIGGIREVVEDGVTGILVQPQDSHAPAGGLEKLLTDPELRQRLASNGLVRARNYFAWETVAARFEDLYRGIIEKASPEGRRPDSPGVTSSFSYLV